MIQHQIPFRSQCWELNNWQALGFSSRDDAAYWQGSSCGVLCLGMVLEKKGKQLSTVELIKTGQQIEAYSHAQGWSHDGLVTLAKEFGVDAQRYESLAPDELQRFLQEGKVIIVSIKWAFEPKKTWKERLMFWKKQGGHLALLTGFDAHGFYVHHTSVRSEYNWENQHIARDRFLSGFTGRGIVLGV